MEEDDLKYWFVWITAVAGSNESLLVAELVKAGYDFDPLSKELTMYYSGSPSCVIGLRLTTLEKEVIKVYTDVSTALTASKIKYHSLIVSQSTACMWIGSNITTEPVVSKKVSTTSN